jgi:hypothetical protein
MKLQNRHLSCQQNCNGRLQLLLLLLVQLHLGFRVQVTDWVGFSSRRVQQDPGVQQR